MKRLLAATAALCLPAALSSPALAAINVEVVPSSAPNFFGGPSFGGYNANANNSLENTTGTSIGDRNTDPTAYEAFFDGQFIDPGDVIVSNFNSWRGQASPSAPFAGEFGNRLHFGVHITGDGAMLFRGADITGEIASSDGNVLGFSSAITSGSYTATRIGIHWGADRAKGGGDDTVFTAGSDTQLIDEFIYVGIGNAYDASFETGPTDQEKIDQVIADLTGDYPITITGSYVVTDPTGATVLAAGSSSVIVPEPASAALAGLGGLCLLTRRRKA